MELKRVLSARRLPRAAGPTVLGVVLVAVVGVAVGSLSAGVANLAIPVAVGVFVIGLAALDLSLLPVLAVPATLVVARVGGLLSVSDVVLFVATLFSLLLIRGRGGLLLQPLIFAGVGYLALSIPTQILNPYSSNWVEWVHELFLVLGSMVVGFVIGREGHARLALGVYLAACSGVGIAAAVIAVQSYASTGAFQPAYVGDLHKNTVGGMLAVAAVIAFARPDWLGMSRRLSYAALALCGVGMLAAQSRQGLIGAMAGILIVTLRPVATGRRRGRLIWLVYIPVIIVIVSELNRQLASGNQFNSAHQRLTWFNQSVNIWATSPVFGVGMRWWYTGRFANGFQPPNAELEVLTTVGVVGLVGFLAMFVVAAWLLSRLDPVYGTVGLAVVATRFTQAQFDLYWVAGQASLLWIVAGICYGVMAHDRAKSGRAEPLAASFAGLEARTRR
ncbi:MAG: hypothetical protein HIU88_03675 [Acidobacteria bacterium]|nr:hypothetical protein [Acidobacteriota bacterium]